MRVSITDPGMTLMHIDQTVWGLVATRNQRDKGVVNPFRVTYESEIW